MEEFDPEQIILQLTTDEKISLTAGVDFWHTKSIPRFNLPSLRMSDGPNGVRGTRFFNSVPAACFPCGTALGATWDKEQMEAVGQLMADEARAKGAHIILGPTVNMQRSPLGGRGFESFSEDPVLSGTLAAAQIRGIQSKGIAATIKHFVCNDQEHQRKLVNAIVTERALREIYLLPFQIAIRDSDPWALMSSYNRVNGIHVSEDPKLLRRLLREEWGYKGMILSDWFGTYSVSEAINVGLDLEMPGPTKWRTDIFHQALRAGKISMATVNERAVHILRMLKHALESGIPENAVEGTNDTPVTAAILREVSASSLVLLKNEKNILPFKKDKTVAIIGPNAKKATFSGGGSAALRPYYAVSPYEGIIKKVPSAQYSLGVHSFKQLPVLNGQLKTTRGETGFILKFYTAPPGTPDRKHIDELCLDDTMVQLLDYQHPKISGYLFWVDLEATFTPDDDGIYTFGLTVKGTGQLFIDGKLIIDNLTTQRIGDSFLGSGTAEEQGRVNMKSGHAYELLVQFGSAPTQTVYPPGSISMGSGGFRLGGARDTIPQDEIQKAVKVAKGVDQVILCVGLNADFECEGSDRVHMRLPPSTDEMIRAVVTANPNTAVVIQSGTPVEMTWADEASAIVQAWYGGNEGGNAIADMIFGDVNPSGKLPLSFPHRNEDNPAFLNFKSERGRALYGEDIYVGYRFYEKSEREVLFPFGHGLSYSQFRMSELRVVEERRETSKVPVTLLKVLVDVENASEVDGAEVIQVYVEQCNPSINRPRKELKGFAKILVPAGSVRSAEIVLNKRDASSFWDEEKGMWIMEKDSYKVLVGNSSANILLGGVFIVNETVWWKGV